LLFIHIPYDNTSVFRPQIWSDVFYVPALSAMSTRPHRFPLSYNRPVSSKKYICAHVPARPYPSDSYKAIGSYASCSSPLFLSTLPSLSLPLSL
ncbi:hypothetical protein ACTXT7_016711, partial [Hymenolepis weldensis]